jgi:PPOX class probable F420-dependent enzyme
MMIDRNTEFGRRVERHLRQDETVWIVTVNGDGTPEPSLVWFHWDGQEVLVRSQPTRKVRNLGPNPRVALHFDSDGQGGDMVILTGTARIESPGPGPEGAAEYMAKYREAIKGIGLTPEQMAASYSVAIHITPTKLRGH